MAAFYSNLYANQIASKRGAPVSTRSLATEWNHSDLYSEWLTDNSGASAGGAVGQTVDIDNGDTLLLAIIPKGYRAMFGRVSFGAMGASATLIVGLYPFDKDETDGLGTVIDADLYLASEDVSSAGTSTMCTTDVAPEVMGHITTVDSVVVATAGGANYATAKQLNFWLHFMPNS